MPIPCFWCGEPVEGPARIGDLCDKCLALDLQQAKAADEMRVLTRLDDQLRQRPRPGQTSDER